MVFEAEDVYPNKRPKIDDQWTFALAFPFSLVHKIVGKLVIEFEKKNLKVEDMQLMGVRRNFAMKHLSKTGRTPTLVNYPSFNWVNDITRGPVVVMILHGDDAVNKACEIVSNERKTPFWNGRRINFYCSDSVQSAKDDIDMWFSVFRGDLLQKDLFYAFADGRVQGAKDIFRDSVMDLRPYGIDPDLKDNMFWERHVFVLISSIAVRNYKVGGIVHGLELNSFSIRGMKLVKKVEVPDSKVWAEIGEDEFGIVVLLDKLDRDKIQELDEVDGLVNVNRRSHHMQIKRNLIYLSDEGSAAWQLVAEFFQYGAVSWVERKDERVRFRGGYFEATLTGLIE